MVLSDGGSMLWYSSAGVGLGVGENPESKDYVAQKWRGLEDGGFRGKRIGALLGKSTICYTY